jgi:hypothetical protein
MDCQCSLCFLLIQPFITPLETTADIPSAGWVPVSGCEERYVANWSADHFHQFPCVLASMPVGSWYVLPVSPGIDGSWKFGIYLETLKGLHVCLTVGKNIDVPNCVAFFYILHYTTLNVYVSACNTIVWSSILKLCPLLEPYLHTTAPVPLFVLNPSV